MPRLRLHAKLLIAFGTVLLPVLALLCADYFSGLRRTQETILEAQSMTAQAVAVQITESFESAIEFGRAVANDPLVHGMDPRQLDAHLQELTRDSPLYNAIGVYDAQGLNRGWGDPEAPAEPRLHIGDRPYFQQAMATHVPVISEVIELRRPQRTAILISVPIPGPGGPPMGVVNVIMQTGMLEQRYLGARLQSGQEILLVDPSGQLAFHTGHPDLPYARGDAFLSFPPIHLALAGTAVKLDEFADPFSQQPSLGAFVPTPRHHWAVGVTAPRQVALAPAHAWLHAKLAIFAGILLLSAFVAAVLARFYSHPVRRLQMLAQALGRGEVGERVSIQTGDELQELGDAFNEMAQRVTQRQTEVDTLLDRELSLSRISQALVREVELDRIAHVAIEEGLQALGADAVGLWLVKPEHPQLSLMASHGLAEKVREELKLISFEAPLLTAQAARLGRLQVAESLLSREVPAPVRAMAMEEGFQGLVAIPLHSRGHLVAVMTCFTYGPRQFTARELEFHTMVGQLFAMAIEKARLFREVREALRLREEFMSAAAHELRTPVTTIQTWADILGRMEVNSARQQKGLTAIARNTRRLAQLVEHLFAAVWMAPGLPKMERGPFDLGQVVEEKVKSISRTTENPIRVEAGGALVVDGDRQRMGDVVAHLLENAIRYSPPGGAIEVHLQSSQREAVVSVRDHGPGIPPERQPHVFEPLYEPLPSGAHGYTGVVGLGLHLSWQIIEAHGGRIWLESDQGHGSTFRFSLPLGEGPSLHYANA